ncbi:tetratricopeptide repeat protein, partial [Acinetobacter baumannii]
LLARQQAFAYWNFDHSEAHRTAAHDALERSMALAPESLETLKAQGFYRYWIERDYAAAITIFERIRQQSPSDDAATYALAAIARRQGRWSDSL